MSSGWKVSRQNTSGLQAAHTAPSDAWNAGININGQGGQGAQATQSAPIDDSVGDEICEECSNSLKDSHVTNLHTHGLHVSGNEDDPFINIDITLKKIKLLKDEMGIELKQYDMMHPIRKSKLETAKYKTKQTNNSSSRNNNKNKNNNNSHTINDESHQLYIASLQGRKLPRYCWDDAIDMNLKSRRLKLFSISLFLFCIK